MESFYPAAKVEAQNIVENVKNKFFAGSSHNGTRPFFDRCFEMPVYTITVIFTILVLIELSLANSVLFCNSHSCHAAYCVAKANMMSSIIG